MKSIRFLFAFTLTIIIIASIMITPRGATVLLLGDADGNGEVCITDATMIQRNVAKITAIEDSFLRSADVDSDGIITIMDATSIQLWLAQFTVAYPVGEPISITAEETTVAHHTVPSENPTDKPTKQTVITRNNKTVTVEGITFNISKIPDAITLDDSTGNESSFMLLNRILPNPADVHIDINDCNNIRRIDYCDARFKENYLAADDRKGIGCDYLICDDKGNEVAWVSAHLTNTSYPYQVLICGFSNSTCSFSVDFYYRDVLLKQTIVTINLSEGFGYCDTVKTAVRKIESACWKTDMTDKEKLRAFAEYIKSHYTLGQMKCTDGALYTAFAERDLGLDSMLFYPEENDHPDLVTYNLYYNTTVPGGHCACLVECEDCTMRYDVQGEAYVISEYNH